MSDKIVNPFTSTFTKSVSPAGQVFAYYKGRLVFEEVWGKPYRYYDVASLTKILFTNSLLIDLVKNKELSLQKEIKYYLPYMHKGVKVSNLLCHNAGYTWWKPFYKMFPSDMPATLRWSLLKNIIAHEKRSSKVKAVYSDIDYFILGFLLEQLYQQPLSSLVLRLPYDFHFNKNNRLTYSKQDYAPSELCKWRKQRLQGQVHDQNTWALGGVAPHAGLFSGKKGLNDWFLDFRQNVYSDVVWQRFTKRSIAKSKGDWALGFMMPSFNNASCGSFFSKKSVGHTGFSGTSLWFDPVHDIGVVILTNRLYYGVQNKNHIKFRPLVHDFIFKEIYG